MVPLRGPGGRNDPPSQGAAPFLRSLGRMASYAREAFVTVLALRPDSTPRPASQVSLWWVGAGALPTFLERIEPAPHLALRPEMLPLRGVDLVVAETSPEHTAESLIKRIRERCPRADVVFLVPDLNDVREVALLGPGSCWTPPRRTP